MAGTGGARRSGRTLGYVVAVGVATPSPKPEPFRETPPAPGKPPPS